MPSDKGTIFKDATTLVRGDFVDGEYNTQGYLFGEGDSDVFRFRLQEGQEVTISVDSLDLYNDAGNLISVPDTELLLLSASGEILGEVDALAGGTESFSYTADHSGIYYLLVMGPSTSTASYPGDYDLSILG